MIHTSPLGNVEIPETLLTPFVLRHADRLGDAPALIDGPSGRRIAYRDLASSVQTLAGGLLARGFARGDVLAIMAPNLPEYAVAFHGTAWAGGTVTTINPTYTAGEVRHQLKDSGAKILVAARAVADVATEAALGTGVAEVVWIEAGGATALTDLMGAPLAAQAPVEPTSVVALPYSSGTTGLS